MTIQASIRRRLRARRRAVGVLTALAVPALVGIGPSAPATAWLSDSARTQACPTLAIPDHPAVQFHVALLSSADRRPHIEKNLGRSGLYLDFIQDVLCQHHLPRGLMYMVLVESEFNASAVSRAGAKGLWQFRTLTARSLGLRVDGLVDERSDPELSTYAAALHLRYLFNRFGSWELALAAYNAGETRVARAIEEGGTRNFWTLRAKRLLPYQTREYVPKFFAVLQIARDPEAHNLGPIEYLEGSPLASIHVDPWTDPRPVAVMMGMSLRELRNLNPQLRESFFARSKSGFGGGSRFGQQDPLRLRVPADPETLILLQDLVS